MAYGMACATYCIQLLSFLSIVKVPCCWTLLWFAQAAHRADALARIQLFTDKFALRPASETKRDATRNEFQDFLRTQYPVAAQPLAICSAQDVLLFLGDHFRRMHLPRGSVLAPSTLEGALSSVKTLFDEAGRSGQHNPATAHWVKQFVRAYRNFAPQAGAFETSVPALSPRKFRLLVDFLQQQADATQERGDTVAALLALRDGRHSPTYGTHSTARAIRPTSWCRTSMSLARTGPHSPQCSPRLRRLTSGGCCLSRIGPITKSALLLKYSAFLPRT